METFWEIVLALIAVTLLGILIGTAATVDELEHRVIALEQRK